MRWPQLRRSRRSGRRQPRGVWSRRGRVDRQELPRGSPREDGWRSALERAPTRRRGMRLVRRAAGLDHCNSRRMGRRAPRRASACSRPQPLARRRRSRVVASPFSMSVPICRRTSQSPWLRRSSSVATRRAIGPSPSAGSACFMRMGSRRDATLATRPSPRVEAEGVLQQIGESRRPCRLEDDVEPEPVLRLERSEGPRRESLRRREDNRLAACDPEPRTPRSLGAAARRAHVRAVGRGSHVEVVCRQRIPLRRSPRRRDHDVADAVLVERLEGGEERRPRHGRGGDRVVLALAVDGPRDPIREGYARERATKSE